MLLGQGRNREDSRHLTSYILRGGAWDEVRAGQSRTEPVKFIENAMMFNCCFNGVRKVTFLYFMTLLIRVESNNSLNMYCNIDPKIYSTSNTEK